MKRFLLLALYFAVSTFYPSSLRAQQYIFTNDNVQDDYGNNTTSVFKVSASGALTYLNSYPTGGLGSSGNYYAVVGVLSVRTKSRQCLFVSDGYSDDVAAFTIRLADGSLKPVVGSPFPTGGYDVLNGTNLSKLPTSEISLAVAQNSKSDILLFAGNTVPRTITVFKVSSKCSLKETNVYTLGGGPESMKATPDGKYLVTSLLGRVDSFRINFAAGALTELGPFAAQGDAAGLDISCDGSKAYFGDIASGTQVEVFDIRPSGKLSEIQNFTNRHGDNSNNVLLSADGTLLYVSNTQSNQITVLEVGSKGKLTYASSTKLKNPGVYAQNMVTSATGNRLFVAEENEPDQIGVLTPSGTQLKEMNSSPFVEPPNGSPATPFSLTVVPGKSCP